MTSRAKWGGWDFIYDPQVRAYGMQAFVVAIVVWLGWEAVSNTLSNLEKQNIASGFGFLDETAGFGIIQTLIPYSEQSSYGRVFFVGLLNTLLVAVIGIVLATVLGFLVGLGRLSKNWLISTLSMIYVEIVRNIPVLLQLFFWYFAVLRVLPLPKQSLSAGDLIFLNNRGLFAPKPLFGDGFGFVVIAILVGVGIAVAVMRWAKKRQMETGERPGTLWLVLAALLGLPLMTYFVMGMPLDFEMPVKTRFNLVGGLKIIPELIALVLALSIYTAAYIAEIVRGGIMAVDKGQSEAAKSLGLKSGTALRLVIIPQAMRVIIPPLTNQYLNLTKNSSLAVAIAYPDLVSVFTGIVLTQTGQAVEVVLMTMAVYLTLSLLMSLGMNWYNARIALMER